MAQCVKCGKKGLFVRVDKNGLCKECALCSNDMPQQQNKQRRSVSAATYATTDIVEVLRHGELLQYFKLTEEETKELSHITRTDTSFLSRVTDPASVYMSVAELLIFSERQYNPIIAYKFLLTISFFPEMDIVRLHYAELHLIERLYKLRNENSNALKMCEVLCVDNINNIPVLLNRLPSNKKEDIIPYFPSIKRLAIIYENRNSIANAIEISQIGAYFNPSQGYESRIARLLKKTGTEDTSVDDIGLIYTSKDLSACLDKKQVLAHIHNVLYKKSHSYEKTSSMPVDYTVIDIETTGLNYNYDSIVELGAIKYRNNEEISRFQTLVNPQCHIPESATAVNNITDSMVANSPKIEEVLSSFISFIGNDTVVGHNVGFDIRFMLHACYILQKNAPQITAVDTLPLARRYIDNQKVNGYSLDEIRQFLNIHETGHRAISDCIVTKELYFYCQQSADKK